MEGSTSERPGPLYEMVKRHVVSKIEQGVWGPNTKMPSELEFVSEFGISRMTVHRALRELTASGLIVRVPGVGTFVSDGAPKSVPLELRDISEDIRARGGQHTAQVVKLEEAAVSGESARALETKEGSVLYHSLIVHRDGDAEVQLEERFVLPRFAPDYLTQDFTTTTPFSYLRRTSKPTQLEHYIHAVLPTRFICRQLNIKPTEPCILLTRRTWVGATVATFSRFHYPGSRYRLRDVHRWT